MKWIDDFLNKITMYRLVLYYLIVLLVVALVYTFLGILPYKPFDLIAMTGLIWGAAWVANNVFAWAFDAIPNVESVHITALILALIIAPKPSPEAVMFWGWVAVLAIASKYILAINRKHIFNPAAIAVILTSYWINQSARWWVGTLPMLPFVLIGGVLVVRKIRRFDLVASYIATALVITLAVGVINGVNFWSLLQRTLVDSPLLFFAFVMLTEPLTTPPTQKLQIAYGALTGLLSVPQLHFGSFYLAPEMALVLGNIFSYLVSPKMKLMLALKQTEEIGTDTYDFVFEPEKQMNFTPGQYLEWTLAVPTPDSRGNRRYFTIASSPTEKELRMGVKFYPEPSRFKQVLSNMKPGDHIIASQLSGSFTLPKNPAQKCVFIAGGIGITPFRSMIKYLIDTKQKRDIILLYSNKTASEIAYRDVFDQAQQKLGIKTIYTLTDEKAVPANWSGHVGMIDQGLITKEIPDYKERVFYLSGPHAMVTAFEQQLHQAGVPRRHVKTDYFPGFA